MVASDSCRRLPVAFELQACKSDKVMPGNGVCVCVCVCLAKCGKIEGSFPDEEGRLNTHAKRT